MPPRSDVRAFARPGQFFAKITGYGLLQPAVTPSHLLAAGGRCLSDVRFSA
jgi:hypothetical protein